MSKFSTWLNSLSADASPDTAADYMVTYDASATTSKKVLLSVLLALASGSGIPTTGWVSSADTWTYASADGPTGVFTIAGVDRTSVLAVGMRVKLTQTTAKYFIITKLSFSTDTTVTIYGGTDYTLANAAITSPNYSPVKAPAGFNCDPAKWTQTFTDTSSQAQASPVAGTWYNIGSLHLDIPIGVWDVEYYANVRASKGSSASIDAETTLSTANNSESDKTMSAYFVVGGASGTAIVEAQAYAHRQLTLTSKTTYYLNFNTGTASAASVSIAGDPTTIIRAVCALL